MFFYKFSENDSFIILEKVNEIMNLEFKFIIRYKV